MAPNRAPRGLLQFGNASFAMKTEGVVEQEGLIDRGNPSETSDGLLRRFAYRNATVEEVVRIRGPIFQMRG
jgi:hypothetical protein